MNLSLNQKVGVQSILQSNHRVCLVTVFKNYIFVLKNKENKGPRLDIFFFPEKYKEYKNTKLKKQ